MIISINDNTTVVFSQATRRPVELGLVLAMGSLGRKCRPSSWLMGAHMGKKGEKCGGVVPTS